MQGCRLCPSDELTAADRGVRDFEYDSSGSYTYWRCEACGLLNIDPIPESTALAEAYPATYHAYRPQPNALARFLKRRYWRKKAKRCARYASKRGAILDAGCAFGDLLVELRRLGFDDVHGLDFNAEVVAQARARGLDVRRGEIGDGSFGAKRFDLIVMTNFIEHVYDPVDTLKRCRELLRPGGVIIGETPNVDSWDYALFRREWGGYHTPRHLYLFNVRNLSILAERAGLRVRTIRNLLQPAHWALSIQNRLRDSAFAPAVRYGRSRLFTPLLLLAAPINLVQLAVSRTSLVEFVLERP
jgi:2-polyprenyl-3-methyl-5-hydroxy-6-metoxy-1,4-benzoquinol methylase